MKSRWLVILLAFLLGTHPAVRESAAAEEGEHHCFGLLWCTEREGNHVSRDGFLWLYSSEERGPYSRLAIRPFYSEELDPTKDLLRRSILWPLGSYERSGDSVSSRIVPFYWHGEEPGRRYTVIPPLYFAYAKDDRASTFLLPFYIHRAQGSYYHQRFLLGPLLVSTEDTRQDLHRWDVFFPLVGYSSSAEGADTWFVPVYFSGHRVSTGHNYRFLLPLYGRSESPGSRFRFFFPAFGSAQDETAHLRRFSILGFPPLPTSRTLPALALFEHVAASDHTSHRFFPLYRYVAHDIEGTDLDVLLLYQHHASAQATGDRLFPLYNLEEDHMQPARDFSVLGIRQWSLFHLVSDPGHWEHRLLGLYGYNHDVQNESSALSMFGYGDFSLFRYHSTPSELANRLFPLYRYRHDRAADETQFDALLLYRHLTTPIRTTDRLLPLWDYESARGIHDWHISVLGVDPLVLIHHRSDSQMTANHVFPFYGYRSSETAGSRFSLIGFPPSQTVTWAWYAQERTPTVMAARLFPMFKYEEDRANQSWHISFLGIDPITFFRYRTSPVHTAHHVLPIYGYQQDDASRRWTALGFPPLGEGPAVSLVEVADDPVRTVHRFTPVYAYAHDREKEETSMNALSLYWHTRSKQVSQHSVMPLGSLRVDGAAHEWRFTLFGLDPVVQASLVRHTSSPTETRSLLFPLYDYRREGSDTSFSFGGVAELSLFCHQTTPTKTRHRFFPVWNYETNRDTGETRFGVAGWAPFSLYQAVTTPTQRSRRLFPVYAHRTDLATGRGETDVLWPFLNVKSQNGETTEWSALWWLAHYEKPTSESYEFRLFGASKMAVLRRAVSPERSSFDLNPVLPLFSYSAEQGKGISWNLFGGLVGAETEDQGQTRLRLFWIRI